MFKLNTPKKTFLTLGLTVFMAGLLGGCASPKPGSPEAVLEQQKIQKKARVEATQETVGELPDWFLSLPTDANSVYAAGTATSPDLQLAIDKGTLNAKRTLADRINSLLSSKMKEFVTEVGSGEDTEVIREVERVTSNLITEVNVSGYKQAKAKVLPQGKQYRAYILLQYPLGKANVMLVNQVKKNQILNGRLRASKAFKELEDDIKQARQKK